jgi:tRNA(Ile)-lysidine synthase
VAVSGGGDSVALLRLLYELSPELRFQLQVAHFHHGVRGKEADFDASFVELLARSLGLPFWAERWDGAGARGFEESARSVRYQWLSAIAVETKSPFVATAHTLDDQAETVLHRMFRGSGVRGLAGIPETRFLGAGVRVIRPALGLRRAELREVLTELQQPFRDDESNQDTSRTRAWIRHELIPLLERRLNSRVTEALGRLAQAAASGEGVERRAVAVVLRRLEASVSAGQIRFFRSSFLVVSPLLRVPVLRTLWRQAGWPEKAMSQRRWTQLRAWIEQPPSGRWSIGAHVDLIRVGDEVTLTRAQAGTTVEATEADSCRPADSSGQDGR